MDVSGYHGVEKKEKPLSIPQLKKSNEGQCCRVQGFQKSLQSGHQIRKKKIYFQKQLADNQKNLCKTWQILFSTINKNTKKSNIISHLTVNGLDIEDQLSMACHFNKFFSKIATKTVSNINISNKDPTGLNSFRFSDKNLTKE